MMKLRIKNHYDVTTWNNFSLTLKYDSIASSFGFDLYFDPSDSEAREMFQVGHYHIANVFHNDELLISGFILNHTFKLSSKKELSNISGYSKAGVLGDCQIPTSLYPLQSDGLTLKQIAQKLLAPFKINIVIDTAVADKVNSVYEKTTASEGQTVADYLSSLASQKDIILSHDNDGSLVFTEAKVNAKPFYHFDGTDPSTTMELKFNGQGMHSHITLQKQASTDGGNAGEETLRNPFVPFVFRPSVKTQNSGGDNDTGEAVRNALKDELKNITLTIDVPTWTLNGGELIKPNRIITVISPELYLYKITKWFIEEVTFSGNEKNQTCKIKCVLPEVYSGKTPDYIFQSQFNKGH